MSFSQSTINKMADSMHVDFIDFINLNYDEELSELYATAADKFLSENLGDTDEQLMCDLMVRLVENVTV